MSNHEKRDGVVSKHIDEHRRDLSGYKRGIRNKYGDEVWNNSYFLVLQALKDHGTQSRREVANHVNAMRREQGKRGFIYATVSGYLSFLAGSGYVMAERVRHRDTDVGKEVWSITASGIWALNHKDELLKKTKEDQRRRAKERRAM